MAKYGARAMQDEKKLNSSKPKAYDKRKIVSETIDASQKIK